MSVMKENATKKLIEKICGALAVGKIATVDTELNENSENPVQNKVISKALEDVARDNSAFASYNGVTEFSIDLDLSDVVKKYVYNAYNYIGVKLYIWLGTELWEQTVIGDVVVASTRVDLVATDIQATGSESGQPYGASVSFIGGETPKMRISASLYRQSSSILFTPQIFATEVFFIQEDK